MKDNKKKNKTCFILYSISSVLFALSGVLLLLNENRLSIAYFSLSICFICIAYMYFKKYKKEK